MSPEILSSTHLSSNRVWGQLGTTTAAEVLDGCRKRRVTGEVIFHAGDRTGTVELRAGSVERASIGAITGDAALAALHELADGTFEVVQRLPDLHGALGTAAEFQGELADVPLIQVMRHIEAHALSVTVTVIADWDRGVIVYRDGDIASVEVNGDTNPDRISDLLRLPSGRFRVLAGVLELPVPARRAPRRARTEPFHVGHVAELRRQHLENQAAEEPPAQPAAVPAAAPASAQPAAVPAPAHPASASSPRCVQRTHGEVPPLASRPTLRGAFDRQLRSWFAFARRAVDTVEARLTRN